MAAYLPLQERRYSVMNIAQSKMNTNFLALLLRRRLFQLYTDYFIHVNLNDIGYIGVGVGGEIMLQ